MNMRQPNQWYGSKHKLAWFTLRIRTSRMWWVTHKATPTLWLGLPSADQHKSERASTSADPISGKSPPSPRFNSPRAPQKPTKTPRPQQRRIPTRRLLVLPPREPRAHAGRRGKVRIARAARRGGKGRERVEGRGGWRAPCGGRPGFRGP